MINQYTAMTIRLTHALNLKKKSKCPYLHIISFINDLFYSKYKYNLQQIIGYNPFFKTIGEPFLYAS